MIKALIFGFTVTFVLGLLIWLAPKVIDHLPKDEDFRL